MALSQHNVICMTPTFHAFETGYSHLMSSYILEIKGM